ncbi:MAG: hypothetical protein D6675_03845 [Gemmatimonadetes bacterium]|nr:MAG: hypothetical protein D6675_03845 [Gemmatimonadota bacterium]
MIQDGGVPSRGAKNIMNPKLGEPLGGILPPVASIAQEHWKPNPAKYGQLNCCLRLKLFGGGGTTAQN